MEKNKSLPKEQSENLMLILQARFDKNMNRHKELKWMDVREKLEAAPEKTWALYRMEETGGEPDVVAFDDLSGEYLFMDCSAESPADRRSLCYDSEALDSRKENKPSGNAMDMAASMGIEILDTEQYLQLQELGSFDSKTSSWVKTPPEIRELGGALFGDFRYNTVFFYHNGASSYYAARGFRAVLRV
jgi:hypothetical protein